MPLFGHLRSGTNFICQKLHGLMLPPPTNNLLKAQIFTSYSSLESQYCMICLEMGKIMLLKLLLKTKPLCVCVCLSVCVYLSFLLPLLLLATPSLLALFPAHSLPQASRISPTAFLQLSHYTALFLSKLSLSPLGFVLLQFTQSKSLSVIRTQTFWGHLFFPVVFSPALW